MCGSDHRSDNQATLFSGIPQNKNTFQDDCRQIPQPIITFNLSGILAFSPGTPQHCYCVLITLSSLDFHNSGQHLLKLPSDCIVRHCTYNYIHYFHDILAQRQLKSSYRSGRNKLFNTIDFPNLHCF